MDSPTEQSPSEALFQKLIAEARAEPRASRATEAELRAAELVEIREADPGERRIREKGPKAPRDRGSHRSGGRDGAPPADRWEAKLAGATAERGES
jgi:hypothetical protein